MSIILIYLYLLVGAYLFSTKKYRRYEEIYIFILGFMSFKIITNYRTCSVAYAECKLRNVKRKESYMNKFLDPLVDVRYSDHIYVSFPIALFFIFHYFITKGHLRKLHQKIFNE